MVTWEYKCISLKTTGGVLRHISLKNDIAEECNTAGRDGWELVQALPLAESHGRTRVVELLFKRSR